ncbi:MAG TPA: ATP-binding protein [Thermoanaerobaculia bacterium]|nr:ATP-binding protein [Thermoanaerobaculia bacterium]
MTGTDTAQPDWTRAALDHLGDAVLTTDARGAVTFINPVAERLTGRGAAAVLGLPLDEVLPLRDETGRPLDLTTATGSPRRAQLTAADRSELLVDVTLSIIQGEPGGRVLVLRDATGQAPSERSLRDSEERYRVFVAQSSQGIWRYEVEEPIPVDLPEDEQVDLFYKSGFMAECNEVMARMYGLETPDELLGVRLGDLVPRSDPHNIEYLRSFIRSGYHLTGAESHEVDKEGNPKYFLNNLIGVVENGHLVRVWGTQLDITDRKQLEEELRRRAEELVAADRRKDQFLAMLAHELRNPLAPIRNSVELMRQAENLDPSFQASREMVERQVKHLARLVDDLLDVSRITHGNIRLRKETLDLGAILERAVDANRPLIEVRNHTLTFQPPPEPVRMEADPTRLEQVFSNLLNNAAKYTMPGGHIWLHAELEGDEAMVRVRDTGIGVPPDVLGRVFEPFVQSDGSLARSEGGLGIGLTLVRSLVEMHGGHVEAHSPGLGQGSEFRVRLPARAAIPSEWPGAEVEPAPLPAGRGVRVLVVEDNVDAAESLAALLRLWHHDVHVVHDGLEAIEAARRQQPEVVLLDIGLPGLDGYQVARKLRDEVGLDHALLVAMTGYGQPEDRRRSREAGIQHHFVKPVEPDVLKNLLTSFTSPVEA